MVNEFSSLLTHEPKHLSYSVFSFCPLQLKQRKNYIAMCISLFVTFFAAGTWKYSDFGISEAQKNGGHHVSAASNSDLQGPK